MDDDVLARAKQGDAAAWNQLWRAYAPAVAGYLRLRGAAEPDDLTSEVFLAVFRKIATFDGDEPHFRSWVFVIAHRRLQDERRRNGRRPASEGWPPPNGDVAAAGVDVEGDALRHLGTAKVRELCARLAPDQADVLLLRIVGDLTVDQVASALGKSSGAVKQLQRRAVEALHRLSSREGVPL